MTTIRERNSYNRNYEGYMDSTASRALDNVERELRKVGNWRRDPEEPAKKVTYRLAWKAA